MKLLWIKGQAKVREFKETNGNRKLSYYDFVTNTD